MKETILLVEDSNDLRDIIRRLLADEGYNVIEARSPAKAISICEQRKGGIHLLISDIMMPEISGQELHRRVTALLPGVKAILMSYYISGALLDTPVPFLQKPFSSRDLTRKVREVLASQPSQKIA
jgi:DNA-binding NtrC family response regulator